MILKFFTDHRRGKGLIHIVLARWGLLKRRQHENIKNNTVIHNVSYNNANVICCR